MPADFRQMAEDLMGPVDWQDEHSGFCQCPGIHRHTAPSRERKFTASPSLEARALA